MSTHSALLSGICLLRVLTSILVCGALAVAGIRRPDGYRTVAGIVSGASAAD